MGEIKVVAKNSKAYHEYFVEDTYEAGIVLTGTEIKSIRSGQVSLREGYVQIRNGELWLVEVHIAPYEQSGHSVQDPKRPRKLLMHRKEVTRISSAIQDRGYTLVPLRMYIKGKRAKVEIGVVRGKHQYDKRATIAKRDAERQLQREWKESERQ